PMAGETVLAIGAPRGLQQTVTRGIVSAIRRYAEVLPDDPSHEGGLELVQTDAAINPGNSGGPLIDRFGRVLGMNTWKKYGSDGLGFAISAIELLRVLRRAGE